MAAKENPYAAKGNSAKEEVIKVKASDKYLLQKFNKDFDQTCLSIVDPVQIEEEEQEYQQFSPTNSRSKKKEVNG